MTAEYESKAVIASVLVPLDGSSDSEAVIPIAREAARIMGATVRLLHVSDEPLKGEGLLTSTALQPTSLLGLVLENASGPPSAAILEAATGDHVVLIVMSSTGATGNGSRSLGHVASEVLQQTRCPLILVRPDVAKEFAAQGRGIKRLLLPLDGSPETSDALAPAANLAGLCQASLDVVHVAVQRDPTAQQIGALPIPRYQDQPHHALDLWTREFLRRFCSGFPTQPGHIRVETGDPGQAIVRTARELQSDLILMSWKGVLAENRAATVKTVLAEAPCPVLFLRPDGASMGSSGSDENKA
jgi:nucleotide-binding universal stress UspA family protein